LTASEAKLFREIVNVSHADNFIASDVYLLASYVQAIEASRRASKAMMKNPKMVVIWERTVRVQAQLATKLRLTPTSRYDNATAHRRSKNHAPLSAYETMTDDDD